MTEFETFFLNFDERKTEKMFYISLKNSQRRGENFYNLLSW